MHAGACTQNTPQYSLSGGENGVFSSRNAGSPISLERIKSMSDDQVIATFGAPALDRKDGPVRALRYNSDGCTLFVYISGSPGRAQFADAYDTRLRPLSVGRSMRRLGGGPERPCGLMALGVVGASR